MLTHHRVLALSIVLAALAHEASAADLEAYPIPTLANIGQGCRRISTKVKVEGKQVRLQIVPYSTPKQGEKVLRVVAPKNGVANGQILLKSLKGTVSVAVKVGKLSTKAGALFPADRVRVRYGQYQYLSGKVVTNVYRWRKGIAAASRYVSGDPKKFSPPAKDPTSGTLWKLNPLMPEARCSLEEQLPRCAWLTFEVPRETQPGLYKGSAAVEGAGATTTIPVELEIVDAILPDRAHSPMYNCVQPMWEVLAFGNGVPPEDFWKSDAFWEVVEKYLPVLADLRVSVCKIGVTAPSYVSSMGMVRWIKTSDGWTWDFTALERFLSLYKKVIGKPTSIEASAFRYGAYNGVTPNLNTYYQDQTTGKRAHVGFMHAEPGSRALAVRFVKTLKQTLEKAGFTQPLALGVWHDKMMGCNKTDLILNELLTTFPDLKITGWSHSLSLQGPLNKRLLFLNAKQSVLYKGRFRYKVLSKSPGCPSQGLTGSLIAASTLNAAAFKYDGLGLISLDGWSSYRRPKGQFDYYTAAPFNHACGHMVFPMYKGEVVTSIDYEVFRECCQVYELVKLLQALETPPSWMAKFPEWLRQYTSPGRNVRLKSASTGETLRPAVKATWVKPEFMKVFLEKHWEILRAAGKAGLRGKNGPGK